MPGMDGLETTRMLKEDATFQHLSVILSLSPVDVALKSYISRAGHKYLIKPVSTPRLVKYFAHSTVDSTQEIGSRFAIGAGNSSATKSKPIGIQS